MDDFEFNDVDGALAVVVGVADDRVLRLWRSRTLLLVVREIPPPRLAEIAPRYLHLRRMVGAAVANIGFY